MQRRVISGFCSVSHPFKALLRHPWSDSTDGKAVIVSYMLGSLVDWESVFRSSVSAVCVCLLLDTLSAEDSDSEICR